MKIDQQLKDIQASNLDAEEKRKQLEKVIMPDLLQPIFDTFVRTNRED